MFVRVAVASACVLGAASAGAEELGPDQARAFVVGKLFAYTCFDGTAGMGRIFPDGSVVGTIRPSGRGEVRFASLPAGTIRVDGAAMCAHLAGLPLQPCFRVQRIDNRSFRGSVSGLGFAYCDFYQHNPRTQLISRGPALDLNAEVTSLPVRDLHNDVTSRAPAREVHTEFTSRAPVQDAHAEATGRVPARDAHTELTSRAPVQDTRTEVTSRAPATAPVQAAPIANLRPAIDD
jgi:hypothetical protein